MSVFKRRRFPAEIILLCVQCYCKYGIGYRNLQEMMAERGIARPNDLPDFRESEKSSRSAHRR